MERKVLYVLMLLLIGLAGISEALVITTEYGSGADTYIGNDTQVRSTSTAGASASELRSRYNGGGSRFQCTYLRFDLSEVPSETTFVGAFLQLEATYIKSSTGRRLASMAWSMSRSTSGPNRLFAIKMPPECCSRQVGGTAEIICSMKAN